MRSKFLFLMVLSRQPRAIRRPSQEQRQRIVQRYAAGIFPHPRNESAMASALRLHRIEA